MVQLKHSLLGCAGVFVLAVSLVAFVPQVSHGGTLSPGDLVVAVNLGTRPDPDYGLIRIDPITGDRTILSDNGVGTGPSFNAQLPPGGVLVGLSMTAVTRQSDGSLLVTEEGPVVMQSGSSTRYGRIFQVDPATGNRSIISDLNVNSGPDSLYVGAIQTPSGILLSGGSNLVNVDPLTGNRSLVSGDAIGGNSSIGNGWGFAPQGSDVYLTSTDQDRILKIDTFTGNRTLVSGAGIGAGPALTAPVDVVFDQSGKMLVSNAPGGIFRVDPITGDRTIVTDSTHGVGPDSTAYYQLGLGADGTIYSAGLVAGANVTKAVFAIDPDTGNRTVLSDATHGVGPAFQEAIGLMVVPIPEPSTVVLVSIAVGICLATWNKRS